MIYDINRLPEIVIGHEKDNLTRVHCFDVRPWIKGTPTLDKWEIVVNNPNGDVYIASGVEINDGILKWTISNSDSKYAGKGTYEIVATGANEENRASGPVKLRVMPRTPGTASEEAPEPEAGWVNEVLDAARRAEEAADRAEGAEGGGDSTMLVTVTDKDGTLKSDKTHAEVLAALDAGAIVEALFMATRYRCQNNPLVAVDPIAFEVEKQGTDGGTWHEITLRADNSVESREARRNYISLPNPNPLVLNLKNKTEYYNGGQRVEVDIPDVSGFATKEEIPDVSGFATKEEIPDVSGFATKEEIPDVSGFATKEEIPDVPTDEHVAEVATQAVTPLITWENLPDKPFGDGRAVILPSRLVQIPEGDSGTFLPDIVDVEDGKTYMVTWQGIEYECQAVYKEIDGIPATWMGNLNMWTGEGDPTGEPFIIGALPQEVAQEMSVGLVILPIDEATLITFEIKGADGTIKTIDPMYLPTNLTDEQKATARESIGAMAADALPDYHTPQMHGAVGDGVADDTAAFQAALTEHRMVHIPGGTYRLSGELVVGDNCCLSMAQDTVLEFQQTSGNCISMRMSASIKGNHATVRVPYSFNGNVVYVSSALNDDVLAVPPFTRWDPLWKSGRYLTDLNIVKPDSRGFHYSLEGDCYGVAVYISAEGNAASETASKFIWGLNFSGVRIAGGFKHGILAENFNDGWNHEMRIEAFIDACETGVELRDCNNAYVSATIQPRRAYSLSEVLKAYAKNGIVLRRSRNTDLSGSRVWDWNTTYTLWQTDQQYEHIAMYGNCAGTILNDFLFYEMPSHDIRSLIYTDTAANLEKINILQEPFTRWFKPVNDEPYFNNGDTVKRLLYKDELDELVQVQRIPQFTDVLATASDGAGAIFNDKGFKKGFYWDIYGASLIQDSYFVCTGYVPVKAGQTIYAQGLSFAQGHDYCRVILFDSNYNYLMHINRGNVLTGTDYFVGYTEGDDGFEMIVKNPENVAYAKFNIYSSAWGKHPVISIDNEIVFEYDGFLADGVKIKAENVNGLEAFVQQLIDQKLGV